MYLCIVKNYWGRGETIDKAKVQARRAGGDLSKYIIYECSDPDVRVDDWGSIRYKDGSTLKEVRRHPKSLK